jgi:hypothetical protein
MYHNKRKDREEELHKLKIIFCTWLFIATLCWVVVPMAQSAEPGESGESQAQLQNVPNLTVSFMGVSPYGGMYTSFVAQMQPMTRDDVRIALGTPTRIYGYADVWLGDDQIYIGYYNWLAQPVAVMILPVTSW